jgi:hypothetical protein
MIDDSERRAKAVPYHGSTPRSDPQQPRSIPSGSFPQPALFCSREAFEKEKEKTAVEGPGDFWENTCIQGQAWNLRSTGLGNNDLNSPPDSGFPPFPRAGETGVLNELVAFPMLSRQTDPFSPFLQQTVSAPVCQ